MTSNTSAKETNEEEFCIGDISEEDSDQSSGPETSPPDELLHSCSYCRELIVTRKDSDQDDVFNGTFSFEAEQMFKAADNNCQFLSRFVEPVETLFKRMASIGYTRGNRSYEMEYNIKELGVVVSIAEKSRMVEAQVMWTLRADSFASADYSDPVPAETKFTKEFLSGTFGRVCYWLEQCHKTHSCAQPNFVPLRLIRIQGDGHIVLELLRGSISLPKYAALSYCWGKQKNFSAESRRLVNMTTGIRIERLPKTIRDAIYVTKQLGLRYLWVDSLCIMQDDLSEKYAQISEMPEIYKAAYVTIAASRAAHCSEGFIDTEVKTNSLFQLPCASSNQVRRSITLAARAFVPTNPLDTRAWALQERMLSPRLLDFRSQELYYGCQAHSQSLHPVAEKPDESKNDSTMPNVAWKTKTNSGKHVTSPTNIDTWHYTVEAYSTRNFSFLDDKLLAISGIADQFARNSALAVDDSYIGGLWKNSLPRDLLWRCLNPRKRPSNYRAPSWSWASVDGEISYSFFEDSTKRAFEREVEIWDSRVSLMLEDSKYGALLPSSRGRLYISGLMKPAEWIENRTILRDPSDGTELKNVNIYPDALESYENPNMIPAYLLNFWQPASINRTKEPKDCKGINTLTPVGFILIRLSDNDQMEGTEERYRRVGLYHGSYGYSNSWFLNSERKTAILF